MKTKSPYDNNVDTFKNKKVLFLENDTELHDIVESFKNVLHENNIEYTVLLNISEIEYDDIKQHIISHDSIVFMTQWVFDISKKLFTFVSSLEDKKTIVECYIYEPTWFYKSQHGTKHDVYIYTCDCDCFSKKIESHKFYLLTNKPY